MQALRTRVRRRVRRLTRTMRPGGRDGATTVGAAAGGAEASAARALDAAADALPFDADWLESRLVWILGSPRTGSTWLLEQLCDPLRVNSARPLGASLPKQAQGGRVTALPVNELMLGGHVAPAFSEPHEIEGLYVPGTLNAAASNTPGYLLSEDYAHAWRPAFRRLVLARLQAVVETASRRFPLHDPLLIIKDVNSSYAADIFMPLFRRSRLLLIVRDGRDVVDSLVHSHGPGGWYSRLARAGAGHTTSEERLEYVTRCSRRWMCDIQATGKAFDAHDPARRLTVRYEELRNDTEGTLAPIVEWLGLGWDRTRLREVVSRHAFEAIPDDRRGSLQKRRAAQPGLWRENLTADEQRVAQKIMGPKLEELGYKG